MTSLPRTLASATSLAARGYRSSASASQSSLLRSCPQCLSLRRTAYPLPLSSRTQSRRYLETLTAYRPRTLDTPPPAPRNVTIPERPQPNGKGRPVPLSEELKKDEETSGMQNSSPSSAATTSAPTTSSTATATNTSTTPKPQRKSRLRARKAAMTLTPSAVMQLRELLNQPNPQLIRIGVKNRGCSGLAYHLEYVDKAGPFDESVEQDGVTVLIDSKALFSIIGSEMDWQSDKLAQRFVFRNPNITEQCGCGESFSVG